MLYYNVKNDFETLAETFCLIVLNCQESRYSVLSHCSQTQTRQKLGTEMAKWLRCQ